ncbi:MAG: hypothetical protein R6W78_05685 [Bacteroidales bacterium]
MLTATFSLLFFHACSKDELKDISRIETNSEILSFKNHNEYSETLKKVLALNSEELKEYEESRGYKSIGRMEDEFYNTIDPESFKSIEELKEFVANNSEYIKIVEDEYGEQELLTINANNSDRYFMNKNGMYQVGDLVYKVLNDEVKISSQVENIHKLMQLDLNNYKTNISSEFKIHSSKLVSLDMNDGQSTLKSTYPGCGEEGRKLQRNGNDRTEVKAYYSYHIPGGGDPRYELRARLRIKNQKQTLGVWFLAKRTTSYDLRVKYHFMNDGVGWEYFSYDKSANSNEFSEREWETTVALTFSDENHIEAYDMWCDTPSIPDIDIECNTAGL